MTALTDHPRFPYGMAEDVRRVITDEVEITLAGFPPKGPATVTAYAEQLDEEFIPADIHNGFRLARRQATQFAPTPSQVRLCVAAAYRARQEAPAENSQDYPIGEFPPQLSDFWRGRLDAPPVDTAERR